MASAVKENCWEQHTFVAHGHNVNCMALEPKFRRNFGVMVTGGDDKKVNMWEVGNPNVTLSLAGHTSPVTSVRFNYEERLMSGSQSGVIKLWDVEAAQTTHTLFGHTATIACTHVHPYCDHVASGSMDKNVKVWDIRIKGCIITYKGHTDVVNHLKFTSDGRWLVSASDDGSCKIWDLLGDKMLSELKHSCPVNTFALHRQKFLMATGCADGTIKFWDLEKMRLVSSTEQESNPIRCVAFHRKGKCLFSSSNDSLKLYGWEPMRCFDSFSVGWGEVYDVVTTSDILVGAACSNKGREVVSVWVTDNAQARRE